MAYIELPHGLPGLLGLMAFNPETARPLNELADTLLRGPNSLTPAERELIAARVSSGNDCSFCRGSHAAAAAHHLGDEELVACVRDDYDSAEVSDKLKALLAIADKVRLGGQQVSDEDVERAREHGATDKEIHDTVLIAATLCMFNRYVDGLGTWSPDDVESYRFTGALLADRGYVQAGEHLAKMMRTGARASELVAVPSRSGR